MDTIDTLRDTNWKNYHVEMAEPRSSHRERPNPLTNISAHSETNAKAALAQLEDACSGLDYGMALMDADLNFILFNEKYAELAGAPERAPEIGENADEFLLRQLEADVYVLPDSVANHAMKQSLVNAVKACEPTIDLARTDGRFLTVSSKRAALGGYLLSVKDVTDRKHAEAADEARWRAVNDAVGSLEEGFSLWCARYLKCYSYCRCE